MATRPFLVLPALMLVGLAQAQPVYRCGNTFSHVPCNADATPVRATSAAAAAAPSAAGEALCSAQLKSQFKESAGVRLGAVTGPTSEVIDYRGGRLVTKTYLLSVSVPDADGMYVGERRFACHLSEDARRVLELKPLAYAASGPTEPGPLGAAGIRRDRPAGR